MEKESVKTLNPTEEEFVKIKAGIKARAVPVNLMSDLTEARKRNGERLKVKHSVAQKSRRSAEWQVLVACMDVLEAHPKVAQWWRQNTGAARVDGRYLKFSFKGASDLMGFLTHGARFLAVETKATGKKPTEDQQAFLDNVARAGGLAMCVDDPQQLIEALASL